MTTSAERNAEYRDRLRYRRVLVQLEVTQQDLDALVRLDLLEPDEREDKGAISEAVAQFLNGATGVVALGNALWPTRRRDAVGFNRDELEE
jgi:hypothetical protein